MSEQDINRSLLHAIDEISELIYVSDPDTYELLYINDIGKQEFHISSCKGLKCYKILQGFDKPCPFCNMKSLKKNEIYSWKYTNPILKKIYFLKDQIIEWNGKNARMEIAFDITDLQTEKMSLQYALDTQNVVLNCIRILYTQADLSKAINDVLEEIGSYLQADRAYIFEVKDSFIHNCFEWCAFNVNPQLKSLQTVDLSILEPWKDAFLNHKCVVVEDVGEIDNPRLHKIIADQGVSRLVVSPMESHGKFSGFFGVDNPSTDKIPVIISLLETLRYFIMITFQRHKDEQMMEYLSFHDALTGLYNRNKYIADLQNFPKGSHSIGIIFADINGLKLVNDKFGHERGDEMIISCTRRLREIFSKAAIYRTGGDEFILICSPISQAEFMRRTRQLREKFKEEELCSAAIGSHWCSSFCSIERMVTKADHDMYKDKKDYYEKQSHCT